MKRLFLFLFFSLIVNCSPEETEETEFICTVDYIEIKLNNLAVVKFDVEYKGKKDSYILEQNFIQEESNYFIGDKLVNIMNFSAKGNQASFDFEYGKYLGPFCVDLFSDIPMHDHDAFIAEADKIITDKNIGRWKIKKKTSIKRGAEVEN